MTIDHGSTKIGRNSSVAWYEQIVQKKSPHLNEEDDRF